MNRLAQQAILSGLATQLGSRGSWVGETHLQKAAYLLSRITRRRLRLRLHPLQARTLLLRAAR